MSTRKSPPHWCHFTSSHHVRHERAKTSPNPTETLGMNRGKIEIGTPQNLGTVNSIIFSVNFDGRWRWTIWPNVHGPLALNFFWTVMLSLPPAYIICIVYTYIWYTISPVYTHTHYIYTNIILYIYIHTLCIYIYTIDIYKYKYIYIYRHCIHTHTRYNPKGPQMSLPGVLFNNPHLSIAGGVFIVGRTGLSSPALGWYMQLLAPGAMLSNKGNIWPNRNLNTFGWGRMNDNLPIWIFELRSLMDMFRCMEDS